jgi:transposase
VQVAGGVDTHLDTHTAAAVDIVGRLLGCRRFAATPAGYAELLAWLRGFGALLVVGVEGTGSYGAGLTRDLLAAGVQVLEVNRPDRKTRRNRGKSDPIDAEHAARAALGRVGTSTPKVRTGQVEALRQLRIARNGAVEHRSDCQRRIKSLIVTAPEPLRSRLRHLPDRELIDVCAAFTPDRDRAGDVEQAAMIALRSLARQHRDLTEHIRDLDTLIAPLVTAINPRLAAINGVGPEVAGTLLVAAGETGLPWNRGHLV